MATNALFSAIPEPTLKRLTKYYQYLNAKAATSADMISCTEIAGDLSLTPIQVRKDLQMAGAQGRPRLGYEISELVRTLSLSLGYDNINEAFLIGAGNFGHLLLNYKGFSEYGFKIVAAFDNNPVKIGGSVNGVKVMNIDKFRNLAGRMKVKIGIITVNADAAQEAADLMVASGIEAIWNLTHAVINVPDNVIIVDVDLGASLSILLSKLSARYKK